jgi:hypothetical protein
VSDPARCFFVAIGAGFNYRLEALVLRPGEEFTRFHGAFAATASTETVTGWLRKRHSPHQHMISAHPTYVIDLCQVISTGPYALVRHPMYTVIIVLLYAVPVALGSRYALIVAFFLTALMIVRTYFEDRTLHAELDGYGQYAKKTPYRFIPGLW